jgi:hypothetical protein
MPDALLETHFDEVQRALERLELRRLQVLAILERRGVHRRDGHLSVVSWLIDRFRLAPGTARRTARAARALLHMPRTVAAVAAGEVSIDQAQVLVEAHELDPEAFGASEPELVHAARSHGVVVLRKVRDRWRELVARERGVDREGSVLARRSLHASATFEGIVRVDGGLDPENGEYLLSALRAEIDADTRTGEPDARTPAQRRADALGTICRTYLERAGAPKVAGERVHLTLTADVGALSVDASAPVPELDHAGPIPIELARRLACDASVTRVLLAGPSEPLDVGRRTPVVPPAIRRALIARDAGCRFPGCDRPHPWCDAHHAVHWADGGETSLANLILLCRRHHRAIHRGEARAVTSSDGRPSIQLAAVTGDAGRSPP